MMSEPTSRPASQPNSPLRILHLEDNEADRILVRETLGNSGIACGFVYASSEAEFAAALNSAAFDLILSDFTMPDYNGEAALALARKHCPGVPYIFVSGTIGEERAIDSLKSGAIDYVLKDRLERLVPAVQRALREAGERDKRKIAESALHQAEARFRSIFENAVEGIYQQSPDGRLLAANRAMARLGGRESPAELCAQVQDFARDLCVDPERRIEFTRRLDRQGEVLGYESRIKRPDGTVIWISENTRAVRDTGGALLYYEGMVADITARQESQAALQRSEERFRAMAESINDVFWISAADNQQLLYVSPAYEQIWGRSLQELYLDPKQWSNAVLPDDRPDFLAARQQLAAGREQRTEYRIQHRDGTVRCIEDRSYPLRATDGMRRWVGVATDITRRKQLESQLLQAQKMEAVGQLAGGVAHDFNNVLTVVTGYARLLLDGGTLPPEAVDAVSQIYTAGMRAANLTRQLLVFSRKQAMHRQTLDLNEVVEEITKMLGRLIGEHIDLTVARAPEPILIEADAGMIEQVLMNLAVNARDAMPGGGALTIGAERLVIDEASPSRHPRMRAGRFVCLSVRDTGCGIAPENLSRIFEPFFTTKAIGEGTGLGLATVFGIVQQHLGWIEVESVVGTGTCFRVLLPAVDRETATVPRQPGRIPAPRGGSETILLVEDEPAVREFGAAVLRSHGYRVLQASSGIQALEVWKWHSPRIALLFSDLVMPEGLGGVELADKLRRERPTLHVILTSGYANETIDAGFRPPAGTQFIHKPYKPQVLAQTVRDALDGNYNR